MIRSIVASERTHFIWGNNMPSKTSPAVPLHASASETASLNIDAGGAMGNFDEALLSIDVTAVTGTAPTMDIVFQTSPDDGTTWCDHTTLTQITGVSSIAEKLTHLGTRHRLKITIGGTTPDFTFAAFIEGKRRG